MKNLFTRIFILFLGSFSLLNAQTLDLNSLRIAQKQAAKLKNTSREISKPNKSNDPFIIDAPVNSNKYLVGPGDQFHLNIVSSNETFDYSLTISPTGSLLIPSVGVIECNGLTLKEVIKEIKSTVKNWNKNIKINVELESIRQFRVLVTGQFENAGYFNVTPMTRVSDLYNMIILDFNEKKKAVFKEKIDRTYSESLGMQSILAVDDFYTRKLGLEENLENDVDRLSKRNITISRNNKNLLIDLTKFKVEGSDNLNPYISQNDKIHIPYQSQFIYIDGGVQKPGRYEFKSGDFLEDILEIAGGLKEGVDLNKIKVLRSSSKKISSKYTVDFKTAESFAILSNDHIMVPYLDNSEPHLMAKIEGQIKFPGRYPVIEGVTTVNDIISEAGGFLPDADSSKIFINNNRISSSPDRELERILLKEEISRSIEEKAYVKARIRTQKGSLEITVTDYSESRQHILTANDDILIPKSFSYVEVIGAVLNPGRYKYSENLKPNDYIKLAGGTSQNASGNNFIVKSMTGQRFKLQKNYPVETGDILFISEKIEYDDERFLFKEYLTSISQIAVLLYYIQFIYIRLN